MAATATASPSFANALEGSQHPDDKTLVIRQVTPEIITFSKPFSRVPGMSIGGRSTAIKLSSGVFVYASTPLTDGTKRVLSETGEVKWLVTPDGEHAMFIEEYTKAYPNAQAIGVTRLKESKPNVSWAGIFGLGGENQTYGFEPEISLHQVSAHVNHELVAIHHPTGTLLQGDMMFNLPPNEQYSRAGGISSIANFLQSHTMAPTSAFQQSITAVLAKNKDLVKRELQPIHAAKWDRIIPCHGDVIETGGRVAWDKLWAKYA